MDLPSSCPLLDGVGNDVRRLNLNFSRVLLIRAEVLLDLYEIGHVAVRGRVKSFLDVRLGLERLFIALRELIRTILFPD